MRVLSKPRRRSPSTLKPRTASGLPSTIMYGGTSCETALPNPAIACAPILTNWRMPVSPPIVTQSPSSTWPPSVVLLASVVWLPTRQSCAIWVYAMIQLSLPTRVMPPACGTPRLKVQNSRIRLRSPITNSVSSPAYFLSCGTAPIELNWKMRLSRPIVVRPSITQCAPIDVPAPMRTFERTMLYSPTLTDSSSCAPDSTIAVGWICAMEQDRLRRSAFDAAHRAHQLCLDRGRAVDDRLGVELDDAAARALELRMQHQLVARLDRALEARAVDADEIEHVLLVRHHAGLVEREDGRCLRERLQHHHAR